MTKMAGSGSGSISQRHGSADPDPDPPQNVMDPQHCFCDSFRVVDVQKSIHVSSLLLKLFLGTTFCSLAAGSMRLKERREETRMAGA
jgi:hypothetical protein